MRGDAGVIREVGPASISVDEVAAKRLLELDYIFFCDEPAGVCCYVPIDEQCNCYHINYDKFELLSFEEDSWQYLQSWLEGFTDGRVAARRR